MPEKPRVILITMGLSRVVKPIAELRDVRLVGVVNSLPRYIDKKSKIFKWIYILTTKLYVFCRAKKICYMSLSNETYNAFEKWLKNLKPDILVVYSMSQLLKKSTLTIPKYGAVNLHPSLLPRYRGPNPWFWTYYNGDKVSGVTLHYIDEGEDTGDIISQAEYSIPRGMRSPEMHDIAITKYGVPMIIDFLRGDLEKTITRSQEVHSPTSRARNIKKSEHKTIINWNKDDVEKIWHIMRGTELWLDCIRPPKGRFIGHRWSVLGYERMHDVAQEYGIVYKKEGTHHVFCSSGVIYLRRQFNIKHFLIGIVKIFL